VAATPDVTNNNQVIVPDGRPGVPPARTLVLASERRRPISISAAGGSNGEAGATANRQGGGADDSGAICGRRRHFKRPRPVTMATPKPGDGCDGNWPNRKKELGFCTKPGKPCTSKPHETAYAATGVIEDGGETCGSRLGRPRNDGTQGCTATCQTVSRLGRGPGDR